MEDRQIVDLYWQRSERAIEETQRKYGSYCHVIARNILADEEDAEETVNDTYFGAWNSMPDQRPMLLSAYLGKLTRRYALKRREKQTAAKRGGGQIALALEELSSCIPASQTVEGVVNQRLLAECLQRFVMQLPLTERRVFLCRYWYLDSVSDIAERFGFSQSKVKSMLHRTRKKLKRQLEQEELYDEC